MELSKDEEDFFLFVHVGNSSEVKRALRNEPYLVTFHDKAGNTPLHYALKSGSEEVVKLVLDSVDFLLKTT